MKVEVLYFDVCPTYKTAEKTLRKVLAEEGIDAEVERVAVSTDEEAKRLRFPEARRSGWTATTCSLRPNARTGGWGAGSTRHPRDCEVPRPPG